MTDWRGRSPSNKRTVKRRLRRQKLAGNSPWKLDLKQFKTQPSSLAKAASSLSDKDRKLQTSFRPEEEKSLAAKAGLPRKVTMGEFRKGLKVETEHKRVIKGREGDLARIAVDHLKEHPKYYTALEAMEKKLKAGKK